MEKIDTLTSRILIEHLNQILLELSTTMMLQNLKWNTTSNIHDYSIRVSMK